MNNWQEKIKLASYTTFKIGGQADYFCEIDNLDYLVLAVKEAKEKNLPIFILGGGSNLLISDFGFRGLVIKINFNFINLLEDGVIEAGAGTLLTKLMFESIKNSLTGLEWAIGIPGTVGGAIVDNSGAYGKDMSCSILEVVVLNLNTLRVETLKKEECQFQYRESIFKNNSNKIIVSVKIKLENGETEKSNVIIRQYLDQRKTKIPPYPSAGSVFKNLEIDEKTKHLLDIIPKEKIKGTKIPVGYLIEECGLRGKKIGEAQISDQHANFIVNINQATSSDVMELIKLCKDKVKDKFRVNLEEEIVFVGF